MKNISKNKEQKILKFIQELSWLVDSNKDITINDILEMLQNKSSDCFSRQNSIKDETRQLVGILPQMFQDEELFPKKEDILSFADEVLGLKLNPMSKRSRIEYIGNIVCKISKMEAHCHSRLVTALEAMLENDSCMAEVKKRKKNEPNFSWNETINKLKLF